MTVNMEFETRYRRYFPRALKFFLNKNVPKEEAKDLAQDTFLRIFRHKGGFRNETSFDNWVRIVAINVWKNYIREKNTVKNQGTLVDLDTVAPLEEKNFGTPEEHAVKKEMLQKLHQFIIQLPEKTRHVVELRVHQELSFSEIAKLLRRSEQTVKSQMSQAKKKLVEVFGDHPNSEDGG